MDIREKLVELLKEISYDQKLGWYDLWDVRDGAEDIADLLIAHGVTVQDWISVKDRLPEGECLAVSMQKGHSYKEMLVGYVYADAYSDTLYTAESDGEVLRNVTHWMPLPQPPKGE